MGVCVYVSVCVYVCVSVSEVDDSPNVTPGPWVQGKHRVTSWYTTLPLGSPPDPLVVSKGLQCRLDSRLVVGLDWYVPHLPSRLSYLVTHVSGPPSPLETRPLRKFPLLPTSGLRPVLLPPSVSTFTPRVRSTFHGGPVPTFPVSVPSPLPGTPSPTTDVGRPRPTVGRGGRRDPRGTTPVPRVRWKQDSSDSPR